MKKKIFFFTLILIFLIPTFVTSQQVSSDDDVLLRYEETVEGDVMRLSEIRRLIRRDRKFNDALKELHKYIERYPNRYDDAYRLVREIMNKRAEYTLKFNELVNYSNEHPEDLDGCGERLFELTKIEKEPPEEIRNLLDLLKEMYLFNYYVHMFDTAQEQSAISTQKGNYVEAVDIIAAEFDNYDDIVDAFIRDWESDSEIYPASQKYREQLDTALIDFKEIQARINSSTELFIRYVNENNFVAANDLFPTVEKDFDDFSKIRNKLEDLSVKYNELFKIQQSRRSSDGEIEQVNNFSYMSFMQRFISGVPNVEDSGIMGAVDHEWKSRVEAMKTAVAGTSTKIADNYDYILPEQILNDQINYDSLENPAEFVNPLSDYYGLGTKVNNLDSKLEDKGVKHIPDGNYKASLQYIAGLSAQTLDITEMAEKVMTEDTTQKNLLALFESNKGNSAFDPAPHIKSLFESVTRMNSIIGDKNKLLPENHSYSAPYLAIENPEENAMDWSKLSSRYKGYVDEIFDYAEKSLVTVWDEVAGTYKDNADLYSDSMADYVEYADAFHQGFEEQIDEKVYEEIKNSPEKLLEYAKNHRVMDPEDNSGITPKRYPELTLVLTEYIAEQTAQNKVSLTVAQGNFESTLDQHKDWKENEKVSDIVVSSGEYISEKLDDITKQQKTAEEVAAAARRDYEAAMLAKRNADALFEQAEDAYNEGRLLEAERLIDQASTKYGESLLLVDDKKLEVSSNKRIEDLGNKILNAKNNIVIYETRALYNKAREEMAVDRYDEALNCINQAIARWAETHGEEKNAEYEALHELINTAVSLQNGRELLPSDPLYAEMSQLMNMANLYYDQGVEYYKEGNTEEGRDSLAQALLNIDKIQKIYPLNQQASLMKLKIEKLQNPEHFESELKVRINNAVAKCKKAATRTEGYNELLTYQQLDPNNKELQKIIYDMEIELGMREKPVDNSAKNRAARLVTDAQKDFNNGKTSSALTKINQAIALDPTNTAAKNLKDRIERSRGVPRTQGSTTTTTPSAPVVLTLNAEANKYYASANTYYNNGNYALAWRDYQRIIAINSNYINIAKVRELRDKIQRGMNQ